MSRKALQKGLLEFEDLNFRSWKASSWNGLLSKGECVLALHKECAAESLEPFAASRGWFSKFITRNKLSRRTPTHVMQQMRDGVVEEIKA